MQGLPGGLRRLGGPQRVHEVVDGDGAALGERQQREHRPALGAAHLDRRAVDDQPQRPEHLHPQRPVRPFPPAPVTTGCRARLTAHARGVQPRARSLAPVCRHDRRSNDDGPRQGDGVPRPDGQRPRRRGLGGWGGDRLPARPLPGAHRGPGDRRGSSPSARGATRATLTEWLRGQAAAGYVTYDRGERGVLADRRAGVLPGRPERPQPGGRVPHRARVPAGRAAAQRGVPHRRGRRPGTSRTRTSSSGATRSTAPATSPSWSRTGSRRSTASTRS